MIYHIIQFIEILLFIILSSLVLGLPIIVASFIGISTYGRQPCGTYTRIRQQQMNIIVGGYFLYTLGIMWYCLM